jgi:hypothetical protein
MRTVDLSRSPLICLPQCVHLALRSSRRSMRVLLICLALRLPLISAISRTFDCLKVETLKCYG